MLAHRGVLTALDMICLKLACWLLVSKPIELDMED